MLNHKKSTIDDKVIKELLKKEKRKVSSQVGPESWKKLKKYLIIHKDGMNIDDWLEEVISKLPD